MNETAAEPASRDEDAALLFDAEYYRNCLGLPYERNEYWLGFFSGIAERIAGSLNPHRVLDAGCAMGMLVEAFWDRGVEAWGIDISPFAISRVRPDMHMYCRQASLVEPITGWYDLVTCIEVLEHMHEDEARIAAANLTRVTDRILFSSTPDDFGERTHFTVRPPIYWLKLFAELGFWPDLEYDAGYITQHAMLLHRRPEGLPIEALTLFARTVRLRITVNQQSSQLGHLRSEVDAVSGRAREITAERDRLADDLKHAAQLLDSANTERLQLQEEQSHLRLNYSQLQDRTACLEDEHSRLQINYSQLQERRACLEEEHLRLQINYSQLQERRACLEEEHSCLQTECSQLQKRIELLNTEKSHLEANSARWQDCIARLEKDREQLEAERARKASEAAEKEATCQKLEQERGEFLADIQGLKHSRDQLHRELSNITTSPAWKIIATYRRWLTEQVVNRSWLVRTYEPLARWGLQRLTRAPHQLPAPAATTLSGDPSPTDTTPAALVATADITYQDWIRENEPDPEELRKQVENARALSYRPLLSIVVPVYRVKLQFLEECVRSVLAQTYDNWELCIADACPDAHDNRAFLSRATSEDPRIKLLLLDKNLGISENSNAALAAAAGDFVVLLDHDDVLAPFAFYEVVGRLSAERNLDLIYSDHDYIDEDSTRVAPLFKPDWSPEVMLSANYITHLTIIRRSLFTQLGGFDATVDSAQDWDFFFRVVRKTQHIAHIPKVLYHWRKHASSTALNPEVHPKTTRAQLQSIQRHLDALGWPAQAEITNHLIHVRWREMQKAKISIIIPSKDNVPLLSRCIQTVLDTTAGEDIEILIVDNSSKEAATIDCYRTLGSDSRIRILAFGESFNYSAMNDFGAMHASGHYLLFLNNDIEAINHGWLEELIGWAQVKEIGAVGAKLLRPNGAIQHAGAVVGLGGFAGHPFADQPENTFGIFGSSEWYRNYLAVTGACMMMRREVFEHVGGFDESFISCGSDVEICLRLRSAGYRTVYNPFARLIHHECATRKGSVPDADFSTSFRHYRQFLEHGDPYWNPNLSFWNSSIALRNGQEQAPIEFARNVLDRLRAAQPSEYVATRAPSEEALFVRWFDFSEDDIRRSKQACTEVVERRAVRKLVWFIPDFHNPYYGGICTILRFADYFRRHKGVANYYVICGSADHSQILERIRVIDSACDSAEVITVRGAHEPLKVPESDACVATLWATAFPALKYQKSKRKFYFVQDYEPLFYPAGSGSALAESTYRFGFYGIANTISLKHSYEIESGQKATHFTPCVDMEVFFPPTSRMQRLKLARPYRQLFCYTRPNHPRNAFDLLTATLQTVKKQLRDRVRIVCAGDDWRPKDYGLSDVVENLGLLNYRQTAELYRESDCGVALMFTRHPSYIPLELMACGALVITNRNRWTDWLLKDGENCLLSEASATCLADTIVRGLENGTERARITTTAHEIIRDQYNDWESQICRVYDFMCDPERNCD